MKEDGGCWRIRLRCSTDLMYRAVAHIVHMGTERVKKDWIYMWKNSYSTAILVIGYTNSYEVIICNPISSVSHISSWLGSPYPELSYNAMPYANPVIPLLSGD
jgi:hypothetical protein